MARDKAMKVLLGMAIGNLIGLAMAAHVLGGIIRNSARSVVRSEPRKHISYPRRRFLRKQARKADVS